MSAYDQQVTKSHYEGKAYRSQERWNSYWHQLDLVSRIKPKTLLEVGLGEGVVARELGNRGVTVTTLDIAEDLHPDIVGSVTAIPVEAQSYDAVLACEILEHIKFEDVPAALSEVARVARTHVIISIPHPGYVFSLTFKLPLLPRVSLLAKIPFFWKTHAFNGEHYWELGKQGFSRRQFLALTKEAGLHLVASKSYADDPAHRFFLFSV
jgi:ubiquinone/menaquinone biosynthesis C-methylase UbiE